MSHVFGIDQPLNLDFLSLNTILAMLLNNLRFQSQCLQFLHIRNSVAADEDKIMHVGKLPLGDVDFQPCVYFFLDQVGVAGAIADWLWVDLSHFLLLTVVEFSGVEYYWYLSSAVREGVGYFHLGPAVFWHLYFCNVASVAESGSSWSVSSVDTVSSLRAESTSNNWLRGFVWELELVVHGSYLEDGVCLRSYPDGVGEILTNGNHISILVHLVFQDDLHCNCEYGFGVSSNWDYDGLGQIFGKSEGVSFRSHLDAILVVIFVGYRTSYLHHSCYFIDVDSDLPHPFVRVDVFIQLGFTFN